ncbi:MAG: DUF4260 domain-containing protein [Methylovirgula sp.]
MSNEAYGSRRPGFVDGLPRVFLRVESGAVAIAALIGFSRTGQSWWLFAGLILAPDLSMLAYLAGPRRGAFAYNAMHVYIGPLILGGLASLAVSSLGLAVAFIWAAHIGIDRLLGFGLKHDESFASTHLGPIGGSSAAERRAPATNHDPSSRDFQGK